MPNNTFEFVISHIEKPDDFYIQLTASEAELCSYSHTLQTQYDKCPEMNLSSLELNQACLAKSSDECWYRGTSILENSFDKFSI